MRWDEIIEIRDWRLENGEWRLIDGNVARRYKIA
jgi:hypothetical protein